jgi:hypothetical protein
MVAGLIAGSMMVAPPAGAKAPAMRTDLGRAHASFWGEDSDDWSGYSVAGAGDVNGDGYDDILIGAPGGSDTGTAYLLFGKSSGWYPDMDLSAAGASFWGEDAGDCFGWSVAGAGDVNGDGYDDLLIGAYFDDDGGTNAGQTYLILGKASDWTMHMDIAAADASFRGEDDYDYSGASVAGAGDVNGDGYDDILIGAYGDEDGGGMAGQTYLVLGRASGWAMDTDLSAVSASFWGEQANSYSGYSVAGAGDLNGDGYDDILIGAWHDDNAHAQGGQAYLVFGKASGWAMDTGLSAASASFLGDWNEAWAGYSVARAGDVNGDGYDDILIGAYGDSEAAWHAGQAFLILGKAAGWAMDTYLSAASASFWGEDYEDLAGSRVAGAGDVNGDGYDDMLISAIFDDDSGSNSGQVYLILGKASGWAMDTDLSTANAFFRGEDAQDYSGASVSGAGDVNGDGCDDLLIGAYGDDDGGSMAGQTYLLFPFMKPPAPSALGARLSKTGSPVALQWNAPGYWPEKLTKYRIYRCEGGSEPRLLSIIPDGTYSYVDGTAEIGKRYSYTVMAQYESGESSEMTCTIHLLIEPDSDMDGIGNSMDADDDRDGIFDELDAQPLVKDNTRWTRTDMDLSNFGTGFVGEDSSDASGYSVVCAGDLNGDGYDDILIGAFGDDDGGSDAGQTYLILGKASGWAPDMNLSNASASFWGEDAGDYSGYSVAGAGDVNGDGYDDILIGAYGDEEGGGSYAGQTYLILGKASGWAPDMNLSNADASFWGEDTRDYSGNSVSGVGDVNGDGYDDILIGAFGDDDGGADAGQTYLILGKASGWAQDTDLNASDASFWGEDAGDYSGYSVAGAGDVNGDSYDDILIGAYGDDDGGNMAGQTYLILGKASGWAPDTDLNASDASFWGEDAGDNSGVSVAGAGEVNGDGYDDILIGAYGDEEGGGANAGQTYLILGKASGWAPDMNLSNANASFWGEDANDRSGVSVTGAGDVNGDGYDDILIGAMRDDDGGADAGQTYLILGKALGWAMDRDLSSADASFWGEDAGDNSGTSVAGKGDINGDGYGDILIGACYNDDGGSDAGQTYLISRTVLSQVQGLSLNLTAAMTGVRISWTKDCSDPYFYGIYRGAAPDKLYRLAATTASNYTDTNITAGATYYYSVTAVGPLGEESPIAPASGMVADLDTDGDGIGNMVDGDDDNDGTPDGQDRFSLNSTETVDTDFDGIGNNADMDDDNDGIPDVSDPEPQNPLNSVIHHLNYANATLQNVQGTVNTLRTSIATMDGNLTALSTGFSAANISLTNLMNGLRTDIMAFNRSMQGRLDNVVVDMAGFNFSLQGKFGGVGANMSGLNSTMQDRLKDLNADIAGFNQSALDRMTTLGDAIAILAAQLEGVNSTLNAEVSALSTEMDAFRKEMHAGLQEILDLLILMNANLTGIGGDVASANDSVHSSLDTLDSRLAGQITDLSAMIRDLNATTVNEIRQQLGDLKSAMEATAGNETGKIIAKIDSLNGLVGSFQSSTNGHFNNITTQMAKLDGVKSDLGKLQKQQEETESGVGAVNTVNLGTIVIMVIVLVLLLVALVLIRKGTGPAPVATPPPPQADPVEDGEVKQ